MPVEVRNVTYIYMAGSPFQETAVQNVSLKIADGEFVGLIGHTGSGKSTLVQHLNGLLKPTVGTVIVDGADITEKGARLRGVRQRVGLVFQYPEQQLFEETVYLDIAFGPKNMGLDAAEIEARVREACAMVELDYDEVKDKSPFELSGGQKRRVAIAGVLSMKPGVLILDEPAAGLDPRGRGEILGLVKALHEGGGVTILMVSHSMEDVANYATRIVVMSRGCVVMDGTPDEVFANDKRLTDIGLDVPETTRLSRRLIERGFQIPLCHRMDALADAIAKCLNAGERPGGAHA